MRGWREDENVRNVGFTDRGERSTVVGCFTMSKLEDLRPNASVQGILPNCLVTVVSTQWFGSEALELTYKDPGGKVANELLYTNFLMARRSSTRP